MPRLLAVKGILWIGDPHLSSRNIGRRIDNYRDSVLSKLSECAVIANKRKLLPIIAGDLFHKNDENDLKTLNKLVKVLKQFDITPRCLEGNHDKGQVSLTDEDALSLIVQTGALQLYTQKGIAEQISINSRVVSVYACPYGETFPKSVPVVEGESCILVSHHDLAMGSSYPGAIPLTEIEGCAMVLNGHMHDTKESVMKGETLWHNKGNIEPLSVDLIDHIPCAWEWDGNLQYTLMSHELTHDRNVFDLTGIQVKAKNSDEAALDLANEMAASLTSTPSKFVTEMTSDQALDATKTSDAEILKKDLQEILELMGASEGTKSIMTLLSNNIKT